MISSDRDDERIASIGSLGWMGGSEGREISEVCEDVKLGRSEIFGGYGGWKFGEF
jgi:hypothetical protein